VDATRPAAAAPAFAYDGPAALRETLSAALMRVVDPEVAMSIVDVGLVYGVTVTAEAARVRLTMTSAACPVADLIIDDLHDELERVLPTGCTIDVELCWEPPWTPDMMSARARRFMQW
jgi:metal-sulfur cluster biosynthetic enzyme